MLPAATPNKPFLIISHHFSSYGCNFRGTVTVLSNGCYTHGTTQWSRNIYRITTGPCLESCCVLVTLRLRANCDTPRSFLVVAPFESVSTAHWAVNFVEFQRRSDLNWALDVAEGFTYVRVITLCVVPIVVRNCLHLCHLRRTSHYLSVGDRDTIQSEVDESSAVQTLRAEGSREVMSKPGRETVFFACGH